jgi:hypothetical protein
MTQRTLDLLVRIAIEIVDWINVILKDKRRKKNYDSKGTSTAKRKG